MTDSVGRQTTGCADKRVIVGHGLDDLSLDDGGRWWWLCACGDARGGHFTQHAAHRGWAEHVESLPARKTTADAEYELRLRFTAADDQQAARLALAWADTCAAEYGTRLAGFERLTRDVTAEVLAGMREIPTACGWCGRAIARSAHRGTWLAVKGEERCYDPQHCDQNYNDAQHEPPSARGT